MSLSCSVLCLSLSFSSLLPVRLSHFPGFERCCLEPAFGMVWRGLFLAILIISGRTLFGMVRFCK